MRYRFIVFRAQPSKETIAFSIYLEEVILNGNTGAAATPSTSPSDEYSGPSHSISTIPVPLSSSNSRSSSSNRGKASAGTAHESGTSRVCKTIERTWDQCEWLQKKIETSFRLQVLPTFPSIPSPKKISDTLYVERHRARIERWLNRVGCREDLCQSGSFDYFISPRMTENDVGGSSKQSFSSLFMNLFGGAVEQEFRVYTPIGEINDYNEDEEEQRREYITRTEECAQELAVAMRNMHAQEEQFGKGIIKATMAIEKSFHTDTIAYAARDKLVPEMIAANADNETTDTERDRLQVSLVLLQNSAEAYYWSTKELSIWKEYNFADTMTEFCTMVGGVKHVMNHSTQMLVLYEKAMQRHQGDVSRANSLRVQYPSDTPSVKYANEQEAQSGRELELAQQEYTDACDMANSELIRYERERTQGVRKALENMALVELESARARCQELKALCRRIKSVQMVKDPPHPRTNIGPMLWHAAGSTHPSMLTPRVSSSSFPRTAPIDGSMTFNDRLLVSARTSRHTAHKYSNSSGGISSSSSISIGVNAGKEPASMPGSAIRRAHTMDNADFAGRGLSLGKPSAQTRGAFRETDEDSYGEDYDSGSVFSPPATASSSKSWLRKPASTGPSSLQQKTRWNGRISAVPHQGYDPAADSEPRPLIDQNRLVEMAADAEMEAELVRSGMLSPRQATRQKSVPNVAHLYGGSALPSPDQSMPPVLPAFRTLSPIPKQLRQVSSFAGISAIPQPVSPSEYLQYSRQTLHTSLSHGVRLGAAAAAAAQADGTASPGRGGSSGSRSPRLPRRDKGKGRAFAV
ncbi:hypothetical protein LPJ53_000116 [Coemansia erecta]|uniref:PX domain-containing protein n=1 Tax=Coemansia erecta TaxID=147472 RepID=A0A9W8CW79_9FUNG|nr:hypothetical protein LPJ53_000116 [Coemansia erecta]